MRVGLVLGAGGTNGYGWHTGVLRGLEEIAPFRLGDITEMVGTSAGAYAVSYLRGGFTGADLFAAAVGETPSPEGAVLAQRVGSTGQLGKPERAVLKPIAPSMLQSVARERRLPRLGTVLAGLLPAGTVSGEPFLAPLRALWAGRPWPAGLRVCAVRVRDGQRVIFDGTVPVGVADAVAASSAIPAYMEPIVIDGETYVDGSMFAPTSADLLTDQGLDLVIVSAPMSAPPEGMGLSRDVVVRTWATRHTRQETEALARTGVQVLTLAPSEVSRQVLAQRKGATDPRRAASAHAAYAQVVGAAEQIRQALG